MNMYNFHNPFCRPCIIALDAAVQRMTNDKKREDNARRAGANIRNCKFSVDDLFAIAEWKSPRSASQTKLNNDVDIFNALSLVLSSDDLKEQIYSLVSLMGVGIPVASAVLAMIDEDKFTPIDVRVLDALGARGAKITFGLYSEYIKYCRDEAARLDLPLRVLDRALWKAGAA